MPETLLVGAVREDVARLHEHVEKVDGKVDTMAIQIAVMDSHVTRMTKEQSETGAKIKEVDAKVEKLTNLKFQVLGGVGVISFLLFVAAELLRVFFH